MVSSSALGRTGRTVASAILVLTSSVLLFASCGGSSSSGGVGADGGPIIVGGRQPAKHRASAAACSRDRPAVTTDAGASDAGVRGSCVNDVDCASGSNGRCVLSRIGPTCSYDACFSDGDCASPNQLCYCREGASGASANRCLPGNCKVDGDCGAGGFCSPSFGTCGNYGGVEGYYCHTQNDACTNDAECVDQAGGAGAYCMWDPKTTRWICSSSQCAG